MIGLPNFGCPDCLGIPAWDQVVYLSEERIKLSPRCERHVYGKIGMRSETDSARYRAITAAMSKEKAK